MTIQSYINNIFEKNISKTFNILLFVYLISYLAGPAVINIYVTIISLFCFYFLVKNSKQISILIKNYSSLILIIFLFYILIKDFFFHQLNIEIISFLRFLIIFLAITLVSHTKKFEKIKLNFIFLFYLTGFLFFDTLFQYLFGYNLIGFEKYQHDRLTSFFDDEPIIGSFLMKLSLPLIFFLLIKKSKLYINLLFIASSIFIVMISGERMPFLQLIFGLLLIFLFFYQINLKKIFILIFLSILSLLLILNLPNVKDRYISTFDGLNSLYTDIRNNNEITLKISKNGIYDYYFNFKSGLELWKKNTLFGNGYRHYKNSCFEELSSKYRDGCSTHPHNIYIEILSDHGIVGLFIFILFLSSMIFNYLKHSKHKIHLGFLITLFVISFPFVTSQSIFSSFYGSIYFLYFFIIQIFTKFRYRY